MPTAGGTAGRGRLTRPQRCGAHRYRRRRPTPWMNSRRPRWQLLLARLLGDRFTFAQLNLESVGAVGYLDRVSSRDTGAQCARRGFRLGRALSTLALEGQPADLNVDVAQPDQ